MTSASRRASGPPPKGLKKLQVGRHGEKGESHMPQKAMDNMSFLQHTEPQKPNLTHIISWFFPLRFGFFFVTSPCSQP